VLFAVRQFAGYSTAASGRRTTAPMTVGYTRGTPSDPIAGGFRHGPQVLLHLRRYVAAREPVTAKLSYSRGTSG
jgi:hypothetical protein